MSMGLLMRKKINSTPGMKMVVRYSTIAKSTLSKVAKLPNDRAEAPGSAESTAARAVRMPVRIKVLQIQVPTHNPYDIGTEETLAALRRSGILTKTGKLGRTFR